MRNECDVPSVPQTPDVINVDHEVVSAGVKRPRQNRLHRVLALSFRAVSFLAAVLIVGPAAADAHRVLGDRIVYTTEEAFGPDAWAMWPDGSGRRQLALGAIGQNGSVAVAPTGTRLAYTSAVSQEFPTTLPLRPIDPSAS